MDGMVTARLPLEKKIRGNEILASLGSSPSKLIGEVYDYLISQGQLPDLSLKKKEENMQLDRSLEYRKFLEETVLSVPEEFWEQKTDDELILDRLEEKYGPLA